jgi:hypothetical protein
MATNKPPNVGARAEMLRLFVIDSPFDLHKHTAQH